jgi:hypothetical protein
MPVNPASRFAAMQALVDKGTWAIDDVSLGNMTIDKVFVGGHFYSSKPALLNLFGAAIYAVIKTITGLTFDRDLYTLGAVFGVLLGTLPWALSVVLLHRLLVASIASSTVRSLSVVAFGAGSLAAAYGSSFNNHIIGVACLLLMWERWHPALRDQPLARSRLATGAIAGGFAIICELTSGAIVAATAAVLAESLWRRRQTGDIALAALLVALLPLVQIGIGWSIAGTPVPIQFIDAAWKYPGSYWKRPIEFDALNEPWPVYVFHSFVGHHGLFSLTPWLLVGIPWVISRPVEQRERLVWYAAIGALAALIGFYMYRTVNYGGRCVGFRWFLVLHPLLALAAARFLDTRGARWLGHPVLLGVLIGAGAASALTGAVNPWEEGLVHAIFRALGAGSVAG